ncbi:MAG: SEC-C domain-containing protein, partial [Hyphomicrobiaceae bacterium]
MATIGRNVPCPCGSGRKYKHCHGRHTVEPAAAIEVRQVMQEYAAAERIRQMQQGRGRPIVSVKLKDHQMVAVGNTVHFSKTWKAFPDFLSAYIKTKLGPEWGNAEIAKPLAVRHPLMQWYDAYCRYQKETIKRPGEMHSAEITGVVACYLGLAYALYLLAHNVELQDRLIKRLRNVGNFQGAYYELMVASILIRAGFKLTLEDETDPGAKHCEFAAVAEKTGKKYWVEAKMRSVNGLLGRTTADGGADGDALGRLIPHLNNALAKPAKDERLIFIDVNAPPVFDKQGKPN